MVLAEEEGMLCNTNTLGTEPCLYRHNRSCNCRWVTSNGAAFKQIIILQAERSVDVDATLLINKPVWYLSDTNASMIVCCSVELEEVVVVPCMLVEPEDPIIMLVASVSIILV